MAMIEILGALTAVFTTLGILAAAFGSESREDFATSWRPTAYETWYQTA